MPKRRIAIIDLGTNTFHLLISELTDGERPKTLLKLKTPVKLGRGGISRSFIAPDAYERALITLAFFRDEMDKLQTTEVKALATSAIRNAKNGAELVRDIYKKTGFKIEIISGDREAELIYYGVKCAMDLGLEKSLIMDIGGGSVEFIICNKESIFWKQSFEIGAQRLLDKFYRHDPIAPEDIKRLQHFLEQQLQPLAAAVAEHKPRILIGSSGTFDTLCDIEAFKNGLNRPEEPQPESELSLEAYYKMHHDILVKNHAQRMAIPGMIELRADMIILALILIEYVLQAYDIERIRVSAYALKEGILYQMLETTPDHS